jgi:hypothetical protein
MEWRKGDMLEVAAQLGCHTIAFTANAFVTDDFRLVMGAGAAKRIRDHFPGVDSDFGFKIRAGHLRGGEWGGIAHPNRGVQADYHVVAVSRPPEHDHRRADQALVQRPPPV